MARNLALDRISLDAHVLYWFFEDPDKLSPIARRILKDRPKFVVSVIVLFELLYMEKKSGGLVSLAGVLRRLRSYEHEFVPVDKRFLIEQEELKRI